MATVDEVQEVRQDLLASTERLAARARRAARGRAVLLCLLGVLLTGFAVVAADAWIRSEEGGMRLLYTGVLLTAGSLLMWKWLAPAWQFNPTKTDVASWIEAKDPDASGLTSAVELAELPSQDKRYGSPAYRQAALGQWAEAGYEPNWDGYVDQTRWRKALAGLVVALGCVGLCCAVWPATSWVGVKRLMAPWASAPWPRSDVLEFRDPPEAIPLGSELQLEVIDLNPPLPAEVDVLVREVDDPSLTIYRVPASLLGNVAVANVSIVERTIEVAIRGGDFWSPGWHRIEVVQPPELLDSSFRVEAPEYTGQGVMEVAGRRVRVLQGSRVRLDGRLSARVNGMSLKLSRSDTDQLSETGEEGNNVGTRSGASEGDGDIGVEAPAMPTEGTRGAAWEPELGKVDIRGQDFTIGAGKTDEQNWRADRSLSWQLKVRGRNGLEVTLPELWTLETYRDMPPRIVMQPSVLNVTTAKSKLALQAAIEDDLGIVRITARARIQRTSAPESAGEEPDSGDLADPATNNDAASTFETTLFTAKPAADSMPTSLSLDELWDWGSQSVPENAQVEIWLEAEDTLGQIGLSEKQNLRVVDPQQVLADIMASQQKFFEHLAEVAASQRRNQQLARRTGEIMTQSQQIDAATVDSLSRVSELQQSILMEIASSGNSGSAAGPDRSLQGEVAALQALLEQNRLGESDAALSLQQIAKALDEVAAKFAPDSVEAAKQSVRLAADTKSHADAQPVEKPLQESLQRLDTAQSRILESLGQLTDQMSRQAAVNNLRQVMLDVLKRQEVLRQETDELRIERLAGEVENYPPRKTAAQVDQAAVTRELDDALAAIRDLPEEQGGEAAALQGAAAKIVDAQVSSAMRRSAEAVRNDNLSQAVDAQDEALEGLRKAMAPLLGENAGLGQRAGELGDASQELGELAQAQSDLADALKGNPSEEQLNKLAQQQRDLQQRVNEQAERMKSLGGWDMAETLQGASEAQQQAVTAMEQGDTEQAASEAQSAAEQLGDAAEQAADSAEAMEQEAQQRDLLLLASELEFLIRQQVPIVEQYQATAQEMQSGDTEKVKPVVEGLVADQDDARKLLRQLRERTDELPAFDWVLEKIDEDMTRAIAAGKRMRVVPEALDSSSRALDRLLLAAEALEEAMPDPDSAENTSSAGSAGDEQSNAEDPGRLVPPLASLKLLRGLQALINQETQAIHQQPASAARSRKLQELSQDQRNLGERLAQLLQELASKKRSQ